MLLDFGVFKLRLKVTESQGFFVIIGHLLKMLHVKYVYSMESANENSKLQGLVNTLQKPHDV